MLIEVTPKDDNLPPELRIKISVASRIAKLLDAQGVTATGQVLGSPAHMAPEQIEGGEVDARADVFGMGVLLYEAMVALPFEGTNPGAGASAGARRFYQMQTERGPRWGPSGSQIFRSRTRDVVPTIVTQMLQPFARPSSAEAQATSDCKRRRELAVL